MPSLIALLCIALVLSIVFLLFPGLRTNQLQSINIFTGPVPWYELRNVKTTLLTYDIMTDNILSYNGIHFSKLKTYDAIPRSVVMHIHVCLWSVGTDIIFLNTVDSPQDYYSSYRRHASAI